VGGASIVSVAGSGSVCIVDRVRECGEPDAVPDGDKKEGIWAAGIARSGARAVDSTVADGERTVGTGRWIGGSCVDLCGNQIVFGAGGRFSERGEHPGRWQRAVVYTRHFAGNGSAGGIATLDPGIADGPECGVARRGTEDDERGEFAGATYIGGGGDGAGDGAAGRSRVVDQYAGPIAASEPGI